MKYGPCRPSVPITETTPDAPVATIREILLGGAVWVVPCSFEDRNLYRNRARRAWGYAGNGRGREGIATQWVDGYLYVVPPAVDGGLTPAEVEILDEFQDAIRAAARTLAHETAG